MDLEKKVRELMRRAEKTAISKVKTLALAGSGIVDDHEANALSYKTAMDFMAAFGDELRNQYLPTRPSREDDSRIRNYFLLM